MESWQKELKEWLGSGEAKIWQGNYYGNASNPTIVYLPGNSMPFDVRRSKVKELISTHILPDFPTVNFVGGSFSKALPYPYYGDADITTMAKFARAINSVKTMKEDETDDGGGNPVISNADTTPLLILISIALVLWLIMK